MWQYKVHCMYSIYCSYTVLLAVDLQYILHPTASILHFGLGSPPVLPVCWHVTLNMTYKEIKHSIE